VQFTGNFFQGNKNGYKLEAPTSPVVIVMRHRRDAVSSVHRRHLAKVQGACALGVRQGTAPNDRLARRPNLYRTEARRTRPSAASISRSA